MDLGDLRITVLATEGRWPSRLRFDFDRPLEDPSMVFLSGRSGALRRLELPPPGEERSIAWGG